MAKERRLDEMTLFHRWRETGDKVYFQGLYQSMKPLLDSAAKKASYGSNLPQSAHQIWAAQNFHDALRTYDPTRGVELQTHVYGAVHQKAKRLNYLYQNQGQIPEPRAVQIGSFQLAVSSLKEQLGREPSAAEIADEMSIGIKDVEHLQKEVHKDLSLDGLEGEIAIESPREEETLALLYYELTNEQKLVYDYIFGKHGRQKMVKANGKIDFDQIARVSGFSTSKARTLFGGIKQKFEEASR